MKPIRKKSDLIESLRVFAATIEVTDPTLGAPDTIRHSCDDGDIFPRLEKSLTCFPIEWRRPTAWEFEFLIYEELRHTFQMTFSGKDEAVRKKKPRKYNVRVTESSLTISS